MLSCFVSLCGGHRPGVAALEVSVHGVGGLMNSFDGAYSLVAHKSAIEPKALFPHAAKRSWPPDGRGGGGREGGGDGAEVELESSLCEATRRASVHNFHPRPARALFLALIMHCRIP